MTLEAKIAELVSATTKLITTVNEKLADVDSALKKGLRKIESNVDAVRREIPRFTEMIHFEKPIPIPPLGLEDTDALNYKFITPESYSPKNLDEEECFAVIREFGRLRDLGEGEFELILLVSVSLHEEPGTSGAASTMLTAVRFHEVEKAYFAKTPENPFSLITHDGNHVFKVIGLFPVETFVTRVTIPLKTFPSQSPFSSLLILNLGEGLVEITGIGITKRAKVETQ